MVDPSEAVAPSGQAVHNFVLEFQYVLAGHTQTPGEVEGIVPSGHAIQELLFRYVLAGHLQPEEDVVPFGATLPSGQAVQVPEFQYVFSGHEQLVDPAGAVAPLGQATHNFVLEFQYVFSGHEQLVDPAGAVEPPGHAIQELLFRYVLAGHLQPEEDVVPSGAVAPSGQARQVYPPA